MTRIVERPPGTQAQECLVHQRGGLQRRTGAEMLPRTTRRTAQLVVEMWQQISGDAPDFRSTLRQIIGRQRHLPSVSSTWWPVMPARLEVGATAGCGSGF